MRNTIKAAIVILACLFVVSIVAVASSDKQIKVGDLPENAQNILTENFAGKKVAVTKLDNDIFDKTYEVIFTDGDKIEFDSKGKWTEIQCKNSSVPSALVPTEIASYVKANYAPFTIVEIEKDSKEYEVKLSNGLEITFDKKFRVIDID